MRPLKPSELWAIITVASIICLTVYECIKVTH